MLLQIAVGLQSSGFNLVPRRWQIQKGNARGLASRKMHRRNVNIKARISVFVDVFNPLSRREPKAACKTVRATGLGVDETTATKPVRLRCGIAKVHTVFL